MLEERKEGRTVRDGSEGKRHFEPEESNNLGSTTEEEEGDEGRQEMAGKRERRRNLAEDGEERLKLSTSKGGY